MAVEEVLFTINWRARLDTTRVIHYNGVLYDITRVDTFEGHKVDVTVHAGRREG
jgi:hypothetical protein